MEDKRPDPNELLAQIRQEEEDISDLKKKSGRGKLKIYLGYCAGVGKTYHMLQEAAANKNNGDDVAIAIVETHKRAETEALISGLEIIPRKTIEYSGLTLEEMDIDAVLKRKPALALVDELAHSNVPGSRHLKRYQDVEELLIAGIDVFTTLNIQHLESMVDIVQQVTGVKVTETVPDKVLELADEVELVDLTPEKLLERLKEGKVYIPKKAEQAMHRFFKKGNLLALRELSLHYTARHVDEDVREHMQKHAIPGPWPVGSRLLVSISSSPTSERLLRFTHRMAQELDAEWFAAYVASPQQVDLNEKARTQLDKNIRLAEELGARVIQLKGIAVADEILNFARSKNVTLIIAGSSRRSKTDQILKGSIITELVKKSGSISVLITGEDQAAVTATGKIFPAMNRNYWAYLYSALAIAITTWIGLLLRPSIEPINIGMLLLLPAIGSGVVWGIRVGLFASITAVCVFDFFFVTPYYTMRVTDLKYLPSFIVFVFVAVFISFLAKSIKQETERSGHRERFVYALYSFSRDIIAAGNLAAILHQAARHIAEAFESNVSIFLPDNSGKLHLKARDREDITLSDTELAIAAWVFKNGQPAGHGTNTLTSTAWYYLPLKVQEKSVGVIGIKVIDQGNYLTQEQDQLFKSFASVVALAVVKEK